jgi:signal transduction histidine kinase
MNQFNGIEMAESWRFVGLCGVSAGMGLCAIYLARVRAVRRRLADRMQERFFERERIARTLHDTYLQSVQGLVLLLQGIATRLPSQDEPLATCMETALQRADMVLREGRSQVLGLRMTPLSCAALEPALREIGQILSASYGAAFKVAASGDRSALREHSRDDIYYIGQEALVNAFHHAAGTLVELEFHYHADGFMLRVRDNGRGMPTTLCPGDTPIARWGVQGMRERAQSIGATLSIGDCANGGTEVELSVPARNAYAESRKSWLSSFRRK